MTGLVAATGAGIVTQVATNAGMSIAGSIIDTAIDDPDATLETYVENAVVAGAVGAGAGLLGGPGTANQHLQSSFSRVLGNGNWSYYFTQVNKEALRAGVKAVPGILRSTIPTLTKTLIEQVW